MIPTLNKARDGVKRVHDRYYSPVPRKWRKVGDSLLVVSNFIMGISAFTLPPIVTVLAGGIGVVGKIITNFATEG